MVASATKNDRQHGQDALREEVQQVTTLLRSIDDPLPPESPDHRPARELVITDQTYPHSPRRIALRMDLVTSSGALHGR
jgi:hypothetical protein